MYRESIERIQHNTYVHLLLECSSGFVSVDVLLLSSLSSSSVTVARRVLRVLVCMQRICLNVRTTNSMASACRRSIQFVFFYFMIRPSIAVADVGLLHRVIFRLVKTLSGILFLQRVTSHIAMSRVATVRF